jgi:hypothetical protein
MWDYMGLTRVYTKRRGEVRLGLSTGVCMGHLLTFLSIAGPSIR